MGSNFPSVQVEKGLWHIPPAMMWKIPIVTHFSSINPHQFSLSTVYKLSYNKDHSLPQSIFKKYWKSCVIHRCQHPSSLTTQMPKASLAIKFIQNVPKPWPCISIGYTIGKHKSNSKFDGSTMVAIIRWSSIQQHIITWCILKSWPISSEWWNYTSTKQYTRALMQECAKPITGEGTAHWF